MFFTKKEKPQLITKSIYKSLGAAREAFVNSLRASVPDLDAGKEFAYLYLKDIKMTRQAVWRSFEVHIANTDEDVTVWDLFTVTVREHAPIICYKGG